MNFENYVFYVCVHNWPLNCRSLWEDTLLDLFFPDIWAWKAIGCTRPWSHLWFTLVRPRWGMYLWNILLKYLICFYTGWAFKGQCYYTIITIMPDSIVKYCRTSLVGEKMTEVCLLPLVEISLRSFWRSTISVLLLELTRYWLYMHFKYEVPLVYLLNE